MSVSAGSRWTRWVRRAGLVLAALAAAGTPIHAQLIGVTSPAYRSDVQGETVIRVEAAGYKGPLTVKSWLPGGLYGSDSVVAEVPLDAEGQGSFTLPASRYPHGPITVRISGTRARDQSSDTCYLQLYNTGGVRWHEGIPATAPPAAKGMSLVFQDDFDHPLSVSATGAGATYAAHKPGGGDFSQIPFTNPTAAGPFFQRDTYLIIRANALLHSTGLLASIRTTDGKGFTVKAPFYMECRLIAPDAPGTWPAWWTLTDEYADSAWGRKSDEIDIIEAYGGDGPKNPNQPLSYMITPHMWGYHVGNASDASRPINMQSFGGGAGWASTPHTYGLLVADASFVFYLDDVEVLRLPASPRAMREASYFMVNLAIGGNGWPVDLSRYGNIVDMYVDYIRVYHGSPYPEG